MNSIIQFGGSNPTLNDLKQQIWPIGTTNSVEFFKDVITPVYLISMEKREDVATFIESIAHEVVLFIDFEYKPCYSKKQKTFISLNQVCSSKGVYIFKQASRKPNPIFQKFLSPEGGHKFVGKGVNGDLILLKELYGDDFIIDLEDVEITRLGSHGLSLNFDAMVLQFASEPCTHFKDKKISTSNWAAPKLSVTQVLYAAFDVVALYQCYPNFRPKRAIPFKPTFNQRSFFEGIVCRKKMPRFNRPYSMKHSFELYCNAKFPESNNSAEEIWNESPEIVGKMLNLNYCQLKKTVEAMGTTPGGKYCCKLCKTGKIETFNAFGVHCLGHKELKTNRNFQTDQTEENWKNLFLRFLENSGRVSHSDNICFLCNTNHEGGLLAEHCWHDHGEILCEWLPFPTVDLEKLNTDIEAMDAAERFLYTMQAVCFKSDQILCKICNAHFIDPMSLLKHVVETHYRITVAPHSVVKDWTPNPVEDFLKCSNYFYEGWKGKDLEKLFLKVTTSEAAAETRENYCDECQYSSDSSEDFFDHCMHCHTFFRTC